MPVIAPCCTPFCSPMSSGSSSASSASSSITLVQLSAEDIAAEIVKVLGPEYEAYAKAVVAQGIDGERIATLIDVPQELVELFKKTLGVTRPLHISRLKVLFERMHSASTSPLASAHSPLSAVDDSGPPSGVDFATKVRGLHFGLNTEQEEEAR